MSLSCAECYALNVEKTTDHSLKYLKAVRTKHFGSELSKHYDPVACDPLKGAGLTPMPGSKGGEEVGKKSTENSESPMSSVNAGDVKLPTTYFVLMIYV